MEITRRQLKGIILQEIFGKKKSEEENYVESFNKFTNLDHAPFKMEISVEDLEDVLETPDGRIMTTGIVPGRLTGDTQSTATDIAKDRLARHALNVPSGDLEVGMYGAVPIYINPSPDKRFKNTTFVTVAIEPRNIIKK